MKKFISLLLCILLLFSLSVSVFADDMVGPQKQEVVEHKGKEPNQTTESFDKIVSDIMGVKPEKGKVNVFFFHGDGCPHCADEERFFKMLAPKYAGKINIIDFEVWHNDANAEKLDEIMKLIDDRKVGIPYTIIGNERFIGFSDTTSASIEKKIKEELELEIEIENENKFSLPILGEIDAREVSIPVTATVLGFVDGFNPCAMWVLLFLINMLLGMQNKKRKWVLGLTFLFISGLVYFCSMIGINFVVSAITINSIKKLLAVFITMFGLFNVYKYFKTRKTETGCTVVKDTKRKKIIERIKEITKEESFIFAIIGVIALAVSVNLVELACSLGFPIVFSEIMAINNIDQVASIGYTLLYILFYMIDDIAVFTISMITLEATGITNKYNKLCTLISGLIMTIMGILLIVKPEWIMLNF